MVEIRNVGNLDKEKLPPLNSQNTDKQTGSSVFFASLKNNEPEASKKNNIRDLDFSNFPSKVTIQEGAKEYKISPQQVAVEKIQEFEEIVQAHNLEYPSSPISIDYTKFPDPKNYDNHCGKKTDFKEWYDDFLHWAKLEEKRLENVGKVSMEQRFEQISKNQTNLMNRIANGFYNVYMQNGITQERIMELAKEVDYNLTNLEVMIKKEINNVNNHIEQKGNEVIGVTAGSTSAILMNQDVQHEKTRKNSDDNAKILNAASEVDRAIDSKKRFVNTRKELSRLKNTIVNSPALSQSDKLDLLNELKVFASDEIVITEKDISDFVVNKIGPKLDNKNETRSPLSENVPTNDSVNDNSETGSRGYDFTPLENAIGKKVIL